MGGGGWESVPESHTRQDEARFCPTLPGMLAGQSGTMP